MTSRSARPILLAGGLLGAALLGTIMIPGGAALAHHSFAMFDPVKVVTLKGEVGEFRWTNPHVALFLKVDGSSDPDKLWAIELTSPGNLTKSGWTRNAVKTGDKVEVEINPLRDGKHGGGYRSIKLANGQVLGGNLIAAEKKQ